MSCVTELSTRSVQISRNDCEDWGLLIVDVLTPNDQVLIEKCTQRTENALPIIDPLTTTYNYSEKQYSTNISNKVNARNARSASLSSKYLRPNQPSFQHNWATSVIQFFYRAGHFLSSKKLLSSRHSIIISSKLEVFSLTNIY